MQNFYVKQTVLLLLLILSKIDHSDFYFCVEIFKCELCFLMSFNSVDDEKIFLTLNWPSR